MTVATDVGAREPRGLAWRDCGIDARTGARRWEASGYVVLSAVAYAHYPDGSGAIGAQWHVSVSKNGARVPEGEMVPLRRMLFGSDAASAEEDNHHPGVARHLWLPIDPSRRVSCECKATETVITEPDGYQWTNPTDAECRGCELERKTRGAAPCTIHQGGRHVEGKEAAGS